MPAAGPPPGPPPPPSATTAPHHRPPGHPEDEQEAAHDGKPVDAGRAWIEGNARVLEDSPQDECARKEQAGTDQPKESAGTPGYGIVLQRVRREGDQDRTKPEKLKDNRRARSAGRRRARYRADATAAAECRVLWADGGGRRCCGAGRGRSGAGVLAVAAIGELAVRRRFRLARLRARTCGQNNDRTVGLDGDYIGRTNKTESSTTFLDIGN